MSYTVRVVGSTAWESGLSLRAARLSADEARDNGLRVVIVCDQTGETET